MNQNQIKFDCIYFRGEVPCEPNKLRGKICNTCDEYSQLKRRILIIKLGAIGDVIRTTPLVVKYKSLFPDSHISWLTLSPEILPMKYIDKVYPFDFKSIYQLKNKRFDIAVNLDKDPEACMLLADIDSHEKFGFIWKDNHISAVNKAAEEKLLTGLFDEISMHNKKSYLEEIFEVCGLKFNNEPYILVIDKEYSRKWNILKEKASKKKIIGLNTGCGKRWQTRLWPKEYWIELINLLKEIFIELTRGGNDAKSGKEA